MALASLISASALSLLLRGAVASLPAVAGDAPGIGGGGAAVEQVLPGAECAFGQAAGVLSDAGAAIIW
jgi:hypothetical protein